MPIGCRHLLNLLLILFLAGCAAGGHRAAPVNDLGGNSNSGQARHYVVKRGDTLYSIALATGTDYRDLARLNSIHKPYTIYIGQTLKLTAGNLPGKTETKRKSAPKQEVARVDKAKSGAYSAPAVTASNDKENLRPASKVRWQWPSSSTVIAGFAKAEHGNKGLDFGGKRGDPVYAAADGKVVYAGSALRGFGNLLIIKHNDDYLSAYAHNQKLLVKELSLVKAGQKIAEMGDSGTDKVKLHFEIRLRGQPVNPMQYLPRR